MAAMSDYLEGELIKHIFRTGSFTKPAVLAVGLFTAAPNDAGGCTEVSGNGYSRATLNPLDANWAAPAGGNGTTSNVSTITFATPSGAGWGTVTHFAIFDAASAGNILFHGALTASKTINSGDTVSYAAGQLQITFA
jgi:hypothetical protein